MSTRDITPRDPFASALSATAELVSAPSHAGLFAELVEHATRTLGLDYAHIATRSPDRRQLEILAACMDGQAIPPESYELAGTPCAEVMANTRLCIPAGVRERYRGCPLLDRLDAAAYVGEPVLDSAGQVRGMIAGIGRGDLQQAELVQANLRILAARAGAEMAHREAMAYLRQERDIIRHVLQTVEAIIVVLDPNGRIALINRKGCELLGYRESELLGQDWFETCLPRDMDLDAVRGIHRKAMAGDLTGSEYYENPVRTRSGEKRLIAWHNSLLRGPKGEAVAGLSTGEDITDRKSAERALVKERERLQLVLDHAPIGIWLQDASGRMEFVNHAFCETVGIPESRFLQASHYTELFPSQYVDQCLESDAEALANTGVAISHERLPDAHGQMRDLRVYKFVKRNEHGEPEALVGLSLDITDELRVEAARRASEARASSMLRAAPVGIGVVIRRLITEVNDTMLRMTGYRREELIGQASRMLYDSDAEHERVGREKYEQIRHHGIGSVETRWRRKDGSLIDIILSSSPIDPNDHDQGVTFTAQDITKRKAAEAALRESETKFHTMVDWTNDWEYWIAPDGRFHYMTPSVERLTGYTVKDFDIQPNLINEIVHPEDRPRWLEHVRHHLHATGTEEIAELDLRIQRKDAAPLWITHRCRPVFDSDGTYIGRRVTVRDITAHKEAEEQIRNLAYFDPLTNLPNRRLLMDRLAHALAASRRSQRHGALLMLDLDHFKTLNDTQGHDAGDRLLTEVARRITTVLRQQDTVSRLGGDEYLILLEDLDRNERTAANEAETIAEKIRAALHRPYDILPGEQGYYCSASIGVTLFKGYETPMDALLKQADVALYQSKDAGRDTVRFFNPEMQAAIESRIKLEAALRQALAKGELRLHYQPQVDLSGRCIGVEALLRWQCAERGLVSPLHFVPVAEESGLILGIGQWVLETACHQINRWEQNEQTRHLRVSINVSARQFHQPYFVDQIRDCLERSGAAPKRLKLELTESAFLEHTDQISEQMRRIKALGVGFSLDDFGTGYSSLSYLKRLPFDQLKIDQTFVRDITTDPSDAAIVMAILAMSQSLGLEVIAEGVETEAQRDFLRQHGCHAFQGYLFGRPAPVADLDPWLCVNLGPPHDSNRVREPI